MPLSPTYLNSQSQIAIDEWLDIDSELCREIDDNYEFTKKILRLGFEDPPFLFTDSLG